METWIRTCLILCSYGFFTQIRPSEPFLTEYLMGPYHNLTDTQIYSDVYPVWTYSYLSLLIIVFLLTDLLRYKPMILCEGFGYIATWCLLLWAGGVHWMQLMQFVYGVATSTQVAYYTYIYAHVDARYYQRVTSFTRSAILAGSFISGISSQILYSTGLLDYHSLNYVSLGCVSIGLCIAFFLPPVKTSIYFHRRGVIETKQDVIESEERAEKSGFDYSSLYSGEQFRTFSRENFKRVGSYLWQDFKEAYSDKYLLKWCLWWSCATCMNLQVGNYIQPVWEEISPYEESESLYNGGVEATSTFLGALTSFGVGYVHLNWNLIGEITLATFTLIDAILLIFIGLTADIWVAYINYIAFRVSYQVLITVASYQVAKELKADSYGLVFGFNTFVSLLMESLLTVVIIEWLEIDPGKQFVIYGGCFAILSLIFFLIAFYNCGSLGMAGIRGQRLWLREVTDQERDEPPVGTTEIQ